jgi:hypothetical protein
MSASEPLAVVGDLGYAYLELEEPPAAQYVTMVGNRIDLPLNDGCEHLPGVLALALGCDLKAGVEDQSHVSEASGSR